MIESTERAERHRKSRKAQKGAERRRKAQKEQKGAERRRKAQKGTEREIPQCLVEILRNLYISNIFAL